jgi:hypothetical protein
VLAADANIAISRTTIAVLNMNDADSLAVRQALKAEGIFND